MKITNKRMMFEMLRSGKFGNTLRTWNSEEEMIRDGYGHQGSGQLIGLRYQGPQVGKFFRTGMDLVTAIGEKSQWLMQGVKPEEIVWCEYLPMDTITMQGQIQKNVFGYELEYFVGGNLTHRQAMQAFEVSRGIVVLAKLRVYMDNDSYDNTMFILDHYPDSVIEFSCLNRSMGTENWNTIFWEVRNY